MSVGTIPNDIYTPLVYIEIDNSGALSGTPAQSQKVLVIGQQLSSGTATALTLNRITTSESAMDGLYGKGAMLSSMLKKFRKGNNYTDVYALGVPELSDGAAAKGSISVTANSAKAGVVALLIAGTSVQVGVTQGQDANTIAAAIVAKVNKLTDLPVTAKAKSGEAHTVEFTCKWKGKTGNDIDIRYNYYNGEKLPEGVTLAKTNMASGSGTPDMSAIIAAIPDEWYNHIANPYNDTQSMNALRDELVERWGPLKMIEGIAYSAYRGTFAESGTYGDTRNDYLFTCMATNKAPNPTWEWAAAYCALGSYHLAVDPARPLQTLVMKGILPPAKEVAWDMTERNLLLHDGMATYTVTPGNIVAIEREVSMYKTNSYGDPDPSYLDITTPATLGYMRYSLKTMVTNRYPRHKLAGDDVLKDELGEFLSMLNKMKQSGEYDDFVEKVGSDLVNGFRAAAEAAREVKEAGQEIMPVVRQIASMAGALIDVVGGYGNLAKILASVYAINKAARIASPVLQGAYKAGSYAMGKKGAKGAASNLATMGATPVFVVNMPAGGLGVDLSGGGGNSKNPKTTVKKNGFNLGGLAAGTFMRSVIPTYLAYETSSIGASLADSGLDFMFDGYRDADKKFTTKFKAFFGDKEAQKQDIEYYGADPDKYRKKTGTPSAYLTGNYDSPNQASNYPTAQSLNLKIDVSDDRINVSQVSNSPSLNVSVDNGQN